MPGSPSKHVAHLRATRAAAVRYGHADRADETKRQLVAEGLADYIRRTVEAAPPLDAATRDRLALLLRSGPPPGGSPARSTGGSTSPAARSDADARPGADAA